MAMATTSTPGPSPTCTHIWPLIWRTDVFFFLPSLLLPQDAAVITSDSCLCYSENGWKDLSIANSRVGLSDEVAWQDYQGSVARATLGPAHVEPFWGKGLRGMADGLGAVALRPAAGRGALVVVCAGWIGCLVFVSSFAGRICQATTFIRAAGSGGGRSGTP